MKKLSLVLIIAISFISMTAFSSTTKLDQKTKTEITKQELVSVDILENVDLLYSTDGYSDVDVFVPYSFDGKNLFSNEIIFNGLAYVKDVGWFVLGAANINTTTTSDYCFSTKKISYKIRYIPKLE